MKIASYLSLDTKNIFRDPMLVSFVTVVPLIFMATLIWLLPFGLHSFEWLRPWRPVLVTFLVMQSGLLAGAVTTFVILEERDASNMQALFVTPLQPAQYLFFRIGLPMIYTFILSGFMLWLAGLEFSFLQMTASALFNAMLVPLFALAITSVATNKVEGLTWFKGLNLIAFAPAASFFIESGWSKAFAVIPTWWIYHFNAMIASPGQSQSAFNSPALYFWVGMVYLGLCNLFLFRKFSQKNFG